VARSSSCSRCGGRAETRMVMSPRFRAL
jgi:hypothetical protein